MGGFFKQKVLIVLGCGELLVGFDEVARDAMQGFNDGSSGARPMAMKHDNAIRPPVFSTLIVPVGAMKSHLAKNTLSRTEKAPLPRSKRAEEMRMAKKKSRNGRPWKKSSSARPRGSMVETMSRVAR